MEKVKRFCGSVLVFWLVYGVADLLIGWIFRAWLPARVLWSAAWFLLALVGIALPVYNDYHNEAEQRRNEQKWKAADNHAAEILSEAPFPTNAAASENISDVRDIRRPDVDACMSGSSYLWFWANPHTIEEICIHATDSMAGAVTGTLIMQGNRVAYVDVKDPKVGMPARFTNKPLVEVNRAARAEKDAPVTAFLSSCADGADWCWKDVEDETIYLSVPSLGLTAAVGKLLRAKADGHFYALELLSGSKTRKRLTPRKSSVAAEHKTAATKRAEKASVPSAGAEATHAPLPVDVPGTAVVSSGNASAVSRSADFKETPVQTDISPDEELKDAGLLQPTEDPGLSEEQLLNHAKLMWADVAEVYSEVATSASMDGESSFTVRWPEGIQSLTEATVFAQYIVKDGAFPKVDVLANDSVGADHERGKLQVWLSVEDQNPI